LEYAVYGKYTMRTLGHISGSAQLLVANERVEVAPLCIEGEGDRCRCFGPATYYGEYPK
jgi:hypothetical protein